jgi:ribosome-associated protein YbcJ (S4-like RNA binding protein)
MKLAEVPGSVKADEQCAHRKHEYMARGSHVEVSDTQYEHVADDRVEESP